MSDLKELEFLANKSKENLEKQIESYRHKHSNAGTIIGIIALFIPFFINGLNDSYKLIRYISLIPVGLLIWAIILMLGVLRTKKLFQFFSVEKYKDLVNEKYEDILLYEIGANIDSYKDNKPIDSKVNEEYNKGIKITTIAILISVILLLTNNFFQPEKPPTKVQLINTVMPENEKPKDEPRVIPTVPPRDREQLNEGVDRPIPSSPKQPEPSSTEKK